MTFRCGGIITENIRTIFRYERNNTSSRNTTESDLMDIKNETDSNDQLNITDNSSDSRILQHDVITSQMSSYTRIVNGADCPPGECPWQVQTLFQIMTFFFSAITKSNLKEKHWLFLNADIWRSFIVQRSICF